MMAVIAWVLCSSLSFRLFYTVRAVPALIFFLHLLIVSHSEGLLRLLLLLIAWRLCCAISRPLCASSVWPAYLEKFYLYCLLCWLALFFGACRVYCDRMFFVILSVTLLLFIQLCVYIYCVHSLLYAGSVYAHWFHSWNIVLPISVLCRHSVLLIFLLPCAVLSPLSCSSVGSWQFWSFLPQN